jgi:hypothetical protein
MSNYRYVHIILLLERAVVIMCTNCLLCCRKYRCIRDAHFFYYCVPVKLLICSSNTGVIRVITLGRHRVSFFNLIKLCELLRVVKCLSVSLICHHTKLFKGHRHRISLLVAHYIGRRNTKLISQLHQWLFIHEG